jgi:hypothetical protein
MYLLHLLYCAHKVCFSHQQFMLLNRVLCSFVLAGQAASMLDGGNSCRACASRQHRCDGDATKRFWRCTKIIPGCSLISQLEQPAREEIHLSVLLEYDTLMLQDSLPATAAGVLLSLSSKAMLQHALPYARHIKQQATADHLLSCK